MFERISNMKAEIKFFIYAFGLGISLIAYGHSTFSTKLTVNRIERSIEKKDADIKTELRYIRTRVDSIHDKIPRR